MYKTSFTVSHMEILCFWWNIPILVEQFYCKIYTCIFVQQNAHCFAKNCMFYLLQTLFLWPFGPQQPRCSCQGNTIQYACGDRRCPTMHITSCRSAGGVTEVFTPWTPWRRGNKGGPAGPPVPPLHVDAHRGHNMCPPVAMPTSLCIEQTFQSMQWRNCFWRSHCSAHFQGTAVALLWPIHVYF